MAEGREHSCLLPVGWTQSMQDIRRKIAYYTEAFCAVECVDKLQPLLTANVVLPT